MILVDTNVVIDAIRTQDPKLIGLFQAHAAAVCGVTRAEVLHGARTPAERQRFVAMLGILGLLPMPDALWDVVGDHLAALRAGGIVVPFQDVVIATVAIAYDIELWTRDQQFAHIQRILPALRLFQEPP
jgi:predicted nucleic acid-binding protein